MKPRPTRAKGRCPPSYARSKRARLIDHFARALGARRRDRDQRAARRRRRLHLRARRPNELRARLNVQVRNKRSRDALTRVRRERDQFRTAATLDALTGVPNRGALEQELVRRIARREPFAVLFFDPIISNRSTTASVTPPATTYCAAPRGFCSARFALKTRAGATEAKSWWSSRRSPPPRMLCKWPSATAPPSRRSPSPN